MAKEKKFRTKLFGGFNKKDVQSYLEKLESEFDSKFKKKENDLENLNVKYEDIEKKYSELNQKSDQIDTYKNKIADIFIKTQEKADEIVEQARARGLEEKKKLEKMIELEKNKLDKVKEELKHLKGEIKSKLKRYEDQLEEIISENSEILKKL